VLNGRVVGLDDELDGVRADRRIDLGGAPVLPGFHDAHFHASITGARLAALDLRPDVVPTLDGLYAAVARRAATLGPGEWLMAAGYDQNALGAHPEADALDAVAGGRPVVLEHVSPLRCIHDMVNRVTASGTVLAPDERLTVAEAVRAYTYGSAYAVGQENDKGTLRAGQLADLVVLGDDLFAVPPERIGDVGVGATVIGGEPVFDDGALSS
jgi:predicted amidohydrolase YtcJ